MPQISIDLDRIEKRFDVYKHGAELIAQSKFLKDHKFQLDANLGLVAAECSFLINETFKIKRFEKPDHGSAPSKVAAFLTFSIPQTLPFRPTVPVDIDNHAYHFANPALAFRLACALVDHPVHKRSFDDQKRFYNIFIQHKISAIDNVMDDLKNNRRAIGDPVEFDLTTEEIKTIQSRIAMFSTLGEMKIFKDTD